MENQREAPAPCATSSPSVSTIINKLEAEVDSAILGARLYRVCRTIDLQKLKSQIAQSDQISSSSLDKDNLLKHFDQWEQITRLHKVQLVVQEYAWNTLMQAITGDFTDGNPFDVDVIDKDNIDKNIHKTCLSLLQPLCKFVTSFYSSPQENLTDPDDVSGSNPVLCAEALRLIVTILYDTTHSPKFDREAYKRLIKKEYEEIAEQESQEMAEEESSEKEAQEMAEQESPKKEAPNIMEQIRKELKSLPVPDINTACQEDQQNKIRKSPVDESGMQTNTESSATLKDENSMLKKTWENLKCAVFAASEIKVSESTALAVAHELINRQNDKESGQKGNESGQKENETGQKENETGQQDKSPCVQTPTHDKYTEDLKQSCHGPTVIAAVAAPDLKENTQTTPQIESALELIKKMKAMMADRHKLISQPTRVPQCNQVEKANLRYVDGLDDGCHDVKPVTSKYQPYPLSSETPGHSQPPCKPCIKSPGNMNSYQHIKGGKLLRFKDTERNRNDSIRDEERNTNDSIRDEERNRNDSIRYRERNRNDCIRDEFPYKDDSEESEVSDENYYTANEFPANSSRGSLAMSDYFRGDKVIPGKYHGYTEWYGIKKPKRNVNTKPYRRKHLKSEALPQRTDRNFFNTPPTLLSPEMRRTQEWVVAHCMSESTANQIESSDDEKGPVRGVHERKVTQQFELQDHDHTRRVKSAPINNDVAYGHMYLTTQSSQL